MDPKSWACSNCQLVNADNDALCENCKTPRATVNSQEKPGVSGKISPRLSRRSSTGAGIMRRNSSNQSPRSRPKLLRSATSFQSEDGEDMQVIPSNPSNPKDEIRQLRLALHHRDKQIKSAHEKITDLEKLKRKGSLIVDKTKAKERSLREELGSQRNLLATQEKEKDALKTFHSHEVSQLVSQLEESRLERDAKDKEIAALHEKNSLLEECWRRKNEETKTKFQQQLSKEQQKFTHELEAAKQQTQSAEEKLENAETIILQKEQLLKKANASISRTEKEAEIATQTGKERKKKLAEQGEELERVHKMIDRANANRISSRAIVLAWRRIFRIFAIVQWTKMYQGKKKLSESIHVLEAMKQAVQRELSMSQRASFVDEDERFPEKEASSSTPTKAPVEYSDVPASPDSLPDRKAEIPPKLASQSSVPTFYAAREIEEEEERARELKIYSKQHKIEETGTKDRYFQANAEDTVDEAALEKRKMINRERSPPSFVWENETNAIVALFSKKKKSKPFSKAIFDMDPKKFTREQLRKREGRTAREIKFRPLIKNFTAEINLLKENLDQVLSMAATSRKASKLMMNRNVELAHRLSERENLDAEANKRVEEMESKYMLREAQLEDLKQDKKLLQFEVEKLKNSLHNASQQAKSSHNHAISTRIALKQAVTDLGLSKAKFGSIYEPFLNPNNRPLESTSHEEHKLPQLDQEKSREKSWVGVEEGRYRAKWNEEQLQRRLLTLLELGRRQERLFGAAEADRRKEEATIREKKIRSISNSGDTPQTLLEPESQPNPVSTNSNSTLHQRGESSQSRNSPNLGSGEEALLVPRDASSSNQDNSKKEKKARKKSKKKSRKKSKKTLDKVKQNSERVRDQNTLEPASAVTPAGEITAVQPNDTALQLQSHPLPDPSSIRPPSSPIAASSPTQVGKLSLHLPPETIQLAYDPYSARTVSELQKRVVKENELAKKARAKKFQQDQQRKKQAAKLRAVELECWNDVLSSTAREKKRKKKVKPAATKT